MKKQPLIFTDLDGTLLDHHDYSFTAALTALNRIKQQGYPLILNSSKTCSEMLQVQDELEIRQPFICENGAAIYLPESGGEGWRCQPFSQSRDKVLNVLRLLREQGFAFTGFNDCSVAAVAAMTGLTKEQAALASDRSFTEPLLWEDSNQRLADAKEILAEYQLRAVQGGRFLSVMGEFDKADAMSWLRRHYEKENAVVTIALGDSPNDQQMLDEADIAVVIKSERSKDIVLQKPKQIIRTDSPGPVGWQWAMNKILDQLE